MPRAVLSAPQGRDSVPDIPNFSWAEYGLRCGMPRILKALTTRGLRASCAMNAKTIEIYPSLVDHVIREHWELIGHGYQQRPLPAEPDEAEVIRASLASLRDYSGQDVIGWLGPGLRETSDTPDLLRAQGVEYVCDWVLDDLPCWMHTSSGPMIAMPYTLELNDSILYAMQNHEAVEFERRARDTLAVFAREGRDQARIITLAVHPHLMGVPHRIGYFENVLDMLLDREDVVFMTGAQIASWFREVSAAEREEVR